MWQSILRVFICIPSYLGTYRAFFFFFSFFTLPCGILVPWPGIELCPLKWKPGVLTTGPPGKSQGALTMDGSHPTIGWPCLDPTMNSSKQEGPGQGREGLRQQLTCFQLAERGTQNASRRVGRRSFAHVEHPGYSSRLGLRDQKKVSHFWPGAPPHLISPQSGGRWLATTHTPPVWSGLPHLGQD